MYKMKWQNREKRMLKVQSQALSFLDFLDIFGFLLKNFWKYSFACMAVLYKALKKLFCLFKVNKYRI